MAYETGTATGHIDLLSKLITFLTTNAELVAAGQNWETKLYQEVPADAGQYEVILRGPGLADDDDVYAGIQTYQNVASDYYNWLISGFTGYDAELDFAYQPGGFVLNSPPKLYLTNNNIAYWFIANGRRFIVIAKVSTVYESCYMGLITPYLPNTLLPYPYLCAGCGVTVGSRWSEQSKNHLAGIVTPYNSASDILLNTTSSARFFDGEWHGLQYNYSGGTAPNYKGFWPYAQYSVNINNLLRSNYDGSYTLFPIIPYKRVPEGTIWGELDGCFAITGYNNSAENIISVGGYDHLVVPNTYLSGTSLTCYFAVKLRPSA